MLLLECGEPVGGLAGECQAEAVCGAGRQRRRGAISGERHHGGSLQINIKGWQFVAGGRQVKYRLIFTTA